MFGLWRTAAIRPLATPIAGFAVNTATLFVGLWRTAAIRPLATPIAGFAVNTATLAPYCASAIRALFLGLSPHIAFLRFDSKILDK